jgi:hypothetical protein
MVIAALLGAVAALAIGLVIGARRRLPVAAEVVIVDPEGKPGFDAAGAARSVQAAELSMPAAELERLWSPMALEQLARTYWRFLERVTLGLIRVRYTETTRVIVLGGRPLVLIGFDAPEYELDANRGIVRWRIRRGLLVARRGRGHGYLEIDVRRLPSPGPDRARIHVEVAVVSFYPAIARAFGRQIYATTQSRIHVLVTHAFLRSLARLELVPSRVGRFAA